MEDARQERSKLKASPLEPPCTRAIHFVISRSSPFFMGWEALSRKGVRLVFSSVVEPSTLRTDRHIFWAVRPHFWETGGSEVRIRTQAPPLFPQSPFTRYHSPVAHKHRSFRANPDAIHFFPEGRLAPLFPKRAQTPKPSAHDGTSVDAHGREAFLSDPARKPIFSTTYTRQKRPFQIPHQCLPQKDAPPCSRRFSGDATRGIESPFVQQVRSLQTA